MVEARQPICVCPLKLVLWLFLSGLSLGIFGESGSGRYPHPQYLRLSSSILPGTSLNVSTAHNEPCDIQTQAISKRQRPVNKTGNRDEQYAVCMAQVNAGMKAV